MRSRTFIAWLLIVVPSIAIVLLTIPLLDGYVKAFFQLIVSNPTLAGISMGMPLVPLIHSAKQQYVLEYYDEIAHSEFSSGTYLTGSYCVPVSGWLNKIQSSVYQETAFDQDVVVGISWRNELQALDPSQDTSNHDIVSSALAAWDVDSVHEFQTSYPVHIYKIEASIDNSDFQTNVQESKIGGPGMLLEQGEKIQVSLAPQDVTTAPTTGNMHIVTRAVIIVIAYDRKKRRSSEVAPFVHILGENDSSQSGVSWPANSNMRVANCRATLWNGLSDDSDAYFAVGKNLADYTLADSTIEMMNKPFLEIKLPVSESQLGGDLFNLTVTQYSRGPLFMKKGENLQIRSEGVGLRWIVQFQYIPDYKYHAEFSRRHYTSNYTTTTAHFIPLFVAPYDIFVSTIKGSVAWVTDDDDTDFVSTLQIMGIKSPNMLDINDLVENYTNQNVGGNLLGANWQDGGNPWNLKSIVIASDQSDGTTNTTGAGKAGFSEAVADFYPAGAVIGVWIPVTFASNIATLLVEMNIEGQNMIKTTNIGTNRLSGQSIVNYEEMLTS